MIDKYLKLVIKQRFIIGLLIVGVMFGYTLFKLSLLNQPRTDSTYLQQQRSNKINDIKIDPQLRAELERLEDTKINTNPGNLGQTDPFNP